MFFFHLKHNKVVKKQNLSIRDKQLKNNGIRPEKNNQTERQTDRKKELLSKKGIKELHLYVKSLCQNEDTLLSD